MSYSSSGKIRVWCCTEMNSWTSQILRSGSAYVLTEVMAGSGINLARIHQCIYMLTWFEYCWKIPACEWFPFLNLCPAVYGKAKKCSDEANVFMNALLLPFYSNNLQELLYHPYLLLIKISAGGGEGINSATKFVLSHFFFITWKP